MLTRIQRVAQVWVLLALTHSASGCLPLHYVTQAAAGQHELLSKAVPLERAVQSEQTPARVRALLARVPAIKAFGEAHGLRATENYTTYADLHRGQVLWVVSASRPFAFHAETWSFPIVGNFTYLGWFRRKDADAFAATLRDKELDVDVRPSRAYSTLGWFKDPVVSPMISDGPEALGDLADVVLHESTHATFFVAGQSALNESVAEFVGNTMSRKYIEQLTDADPLEQQRALDAQEEDAARGERMKQAYAELEALYKSGLPRKQMQERKTKILLDLKTRVMMRRTPNNATLIQYKTYGSGQAEMATLLTQCAGSYPRFFRSLERARPTFERAAKQSEPATLLQAVAREACIP